MILLDSYDSYGDPYSGLTDPNDPLDSYDSFGDSLMGYANPNDPLDMWDSSRSVLSWQQFVHDDDYNSSYDLYFDDFLSAGDPSDWDSFWTGPDIDCIDIGRQVYVGSVDSNNLDADGDGLGCEDSS